MDKAKTSKLFQQIVEDLRKQKERNKAQLQESMYRIDRHHAVLSEDLDPDSLARMFTMVKSKKEKMMDGLLKIVELQTSGKLSPEEQIRLEKKVFDDNVALNNEIRYLLMSGNISMSEGESNEYKELLASRDQLLIENARLSEEYLSKINERNRALEGSSSHGEGSASHGESSSNQGASSSLVKDFADPTFEQPSYMDPED